jgi:hypothetical protein
MSGGENVSFGYESSTADLQFQRGHGMQQYKIGCFIPHDRFPMADIRNQTWQKNTLYVWSREINTSLNISFHGDSILHRQRRKEPL